MHLYSSNTGYHINNEIWLYPDSYNGMERTIAETGLRMGYVYNRSVNQWQLVYTAFLAGTDCVGNESDVFYGYPVADSTYHSYQISKGNGGTDWWVYYDGGYVGDITQAACYGDYNNFAPEAQVGLEIGQVPGGDISWTSSDTFHNQNLYVEASNYNWYQWWYQNYYRSMPCGLGWSPPQCTNGMSVGTTQWNDNKPLQ